MDPLAILVPVLIVALIVLVVVVVLLVVKLFKTVDVTNEMLVNVKAQLEPTMVNVKVMTDDIQPSVKKVEPIMDRLQLTLDAVNLEMVRVDEILEDVSQITDSASSATNAVDTIASAPVKAVSGVTAKVREKFGSKNASNESTAAAELDDTKEAVAAALAQYSALEEAEEQSVAANAAGTDSQTMSEPQPEGTTEEEALSNLYIAEGEEPYRVIDPKALETSPFFEESTDGD